MSPEDRREVDGMFGITKAEADQAMSARPGNPRSTFLPSVTKEAMPHPPSTPGNQQDKLKGWSSL